MEEEREKRGMTSSSHSSPLLLLLFSSSSAHFPPSQQTHPLPLQHCTSLHSTPQSLPGSLKRTTIMNKTESTTRSVGGSSSSSSSIITKECDDSTTTTMTTPPPSLTSSISTVSLTSSVESYVEPSQSTQPIKSSDTNDKKRGSTTTLRYWTTFLSLLMKTFIGSYICYKCLASPPLHWYYNPLPGPSPSLSSNTTTTTSLYLPGGGFSGLFYHLGVLNRLLTSSSSSSPGGGDGEDWDYYCYSSGCIAVVAALTNITLEDMSNAGITTQRKWMTGDVSIYDFTEHFMMELLQSVDDDTLHTILPQMKVIVTSPWQDGTQILQATNRNDLIHLMIKTTWLPFITGWGFLHEGQSMDGGFSRRLHPQCDYEISVPIYWEITKKTFTPDISREDAKSFWISGYNAPNVVTILKEEEEQLEEEQLKEKGLLLGLGGQVDQQEQPKGTSCTKITTTTTSTGSNYNEGRQCPSLI